MRRAFVTLIASLAGSGIFLSACSDGVPHVVTSAQYRSPDSRWEAVLERVDNGLGFGQGLMYSELHIHAPNQLISDHGGTASTVVFYLEETYTTTWVPIEPSVEWTGANRLLVKYPDLYMPGKMQTSFVDITIEYQTTSVPKDAH
jgi:hypothetical protein